MVWQILVESTPQEQIPLFSLSKDLKSSPGRTEVWLTRSCPGLDSPAWHSCMVWHEGTSDPREKQGHELDEILMWSDNGMQGGASVKAQMVRRRPFVELSTSATPAGTWAAGCELSIGSVIEQTSHRPWPLPQTRWVMSMRWHELLFLHWPVRAELIRPLIPKLLELDTFDGWCWIGIVPFRMSGVRPRYIPFNMSFPELNVRTYVKVPGRSGVWFFSLDAANWLAVRAARWLGMPYYLARMTLALERETVTYRSMRVQKKAARAEFTAVYRPAGPVYHAAPDTLDHWLTERYCLYAAVRPNQVVYGEIHHPRWPLQPAEVELCTNTMAEATGIKLPETKPICHFSRFQEVVAWPIIPIQQMK